MALNFLRAGGEMGERIRAHDWDDTPVGNPETWPENLRVALGICLASPFPMSVWWGRELTLFYNDPYVPLLGAKHPAVLGRPARAALFGMWHRLEPSIQAVLETGEAARLVAVPASLDGGKDDVELAFSLSPIHGVDGRVEGLLCACSESAGKDDPWTRPALGTLAASRASNLADAALHRARRSEGTVLVAESDRTVRDHMRGLLEERFTVVTAADGEEAFEEMRRHLPDLALVDVGLPRLDGFALLRRMRADERLRDVPVILISGRGDEDARVDALACGADDYLVRPISARGLLARAERQVAMSRAHRERIRDAASASLAETQRLKARFASDLAALNRLHALAIRMLRTTTLEPILEETLEATMALLNASFGTLQLYDPDAKVLHLAAQRGFGKAFVDRFGTVREGDPCAGGIALRTGRRVAIEDVEADKRLAPIVATAREAGYRAVQSTPLFDSAGKLLGMLSTHFREPRKLGEREVRLLDMYAGLAAAFIERQSEEETLHEADRRKDEFLATLGHELRNRLAPLASAVEGVRMRYAADVWLSGKAQLIDRQLRLLARLVDDLLDVGRIKSGKLQLRRAVVPLNRVLDTSLEECRPAIAANGQELVVERCAEELAVEIDAERMAQVLSNLLLNAAKYTDEGGRIAVSLAREGTEAVIRVSDSGIGIPPAELPHVFDLFSQVRAHRARAKGGLGVGLSLVRSLVELQGGRVGAESSGPGTGSCFTLRLPLRASAPAPETAPPRPKAAHAVRGLKVLVADDNGDAAEALAMLLEAEGYEVRMASDGVDALEKCAQFEPDIALLDIGMPRMDGLEAARRLREMPRGQSMFLVALTGWGQDKDRALTRDAGFDAHLVKPVRFAALQEVLAQAPAEQLGTDPN